MFSVVWKVPIILILSTFKIEFGITGLKALGFSYETSIVFSVTWAVIITSLEYYSVNPVKDWLDKNLPFNGKSWTEKFWIENIKKPIEERKDKLLIFLLNHRIGLSVLLVLLPLIPLVDIAAIVAIRRTKVKFGLLTLILATLGKVAITIFLIY